MDGWLWRGEGEREGVSGAAEVLPSKRTISSTCNLPVLVLLVQPQTPLSSSSLQSPVPAIGKKILAEVFQLVQCTALQLGCGSRRKCRRSLFLIFVTGQT